MPRRPPKHWWRGCVRSVRDSGNAADPESVCGALWYKKMSARKRREILKAEGKSMNANPRTLYVIWRSDIEGKTFTRREDAEKLAEKVRPQWPSYRVQVRSTTHARPRYYVRVVTTSRRRGKEAEGLRKVMGLSRAYGDRSMANPKPCADCAPLPNPNGGVAGLLIAGAAVAGLVWLFWPRPAAATQAPTTPPNSLPPGGPATCPLDANTLHAWASSKGYALFYFQTSQIPTWDWMVKNVPTLPAVIAAGTPILIVLDDGSFWTFSGVPPIPAQVPAQKDLYCQFAAAQAGNTVPIVKEFGT